MTLVTSRCRPDHAGASAALPRRPSPSPAVDWYSYLTALVPSRAGNSVVLRSTDAGRTWSEPETPGWYTYSDGAVASGEGVYSYTAKQIVIITPSPPPTHEPLELNAQDPNPDIVDPDDYPKPKWAHQLAHFTPEELAKNKPRFVSYSSDGARSFSRPQPIKVKCTIRSLRVIYAGGSGYSDAIIMPDGDQHTLAMLFQKTFDPPVPTIEGGGYDMGLALMPLKD